MTTDSDQPTPDADTNRADAPPVEPAAPADELAQLRAQVGSLTDELSEARELVARLERQQRIDELLAESSPIDVHAARLLTEAAVAQMDEPDVQLAIDDLRRTKPYLFRDSADNTSPSGQTTNGASAGTSGRTSGGGGASGGTSGGSGGGGTSGGVMAGRVRDGGLSRTAAAAERAAASGDRRDLLRYLRLRRGA